MLQLKNITKVYKSGDEKVEALKGIDLKFRESEFVSILGQSGCGKTTLLNIIGGLDRYTSGDLIINGKSTKKFKDRDWDAYRNYKVGFIFQNYNLIGHQTILSNVELALTIGGISRKERKQRAIKALEQVGLKDKIHKKPNQLSGGQMQRVAIARALVNDPDIILADEPTGALDTKTSVQIMEILKEISKEKLIIMVTHNPDLAEEYSSRIIRILDGLITEDSNPILDTEVDEQTNTNKIGRTSMKFWTALRLSLNNLLTKKGRTILVSFAGSIGIIGIALVQAVSNGFQNYVDYIQEDTLTSYPLTIMQESADATSMLLAMTSGERERNDSNEVKEEQYISSMLSNITTNDLQSFNNYLKTNYNEIKDDIANISYAYSVEPNIYSKRADDKLPTKLNPSELFSNMLGGGNIMGMSTSVYSQMHADRASLEESYDVLAGHWPEKYDEMIIVLSEPNKISDYLIYSLGLRDYKELEDIVKKVMNGEKANVQNEPLTLSYDDLMKTELKLIFGSDIYKYNENYDIYEDMTENEEYMNNLYSNAINLKIVGIVSAKEGVNSMALNPGVAYTSDLIDYIIDKTKDADIVKKQLETDEIDVISGKRFDSKESDKGLNFADLISVDSDKLQSAFNIKIDQNSIQSETQGYMTDIANSITTDTTPARNAFKENLDYFANGILENVSGELKEENIDGIVADYLSKSESKSRLSKLEKDYVIPKETFETAYSGLLKGLLQVYINAYKASAQGIDNDSDVEEVQNNQNISQEDIQKYLNDKNISQEDIQKYMENMSEGSNIDLNVVAQSLESNTITQNDITSQIPEMMDTSELEKQIKKTLISTYLSNSVVEETVNTMSRVMTEANMKKQVLTKVGELTANLTGKFATAFNVDQEKIASAFNIDISEDELTRVVTAMMTDTKKSAKTNLISFGYQDKEKPTYIGFYFRSFDGKEHFLKFLDSYNDKMEADGNKEKVINYTDTTGILMSSVKTIVNAVTYVLIAFISISLIVSSIMIGIITYISVYERTKEIGILRSIGASKHNISSIFNAETFIIGLLSGLFGIGITYSLVPIINKILHHFIGNIPLNVVFYFNNAAILVILSVILTLIGGIIPSRAAAKRDPVIALRTE